MGKIETILNKEERKWLLEKKITRSTDDKEVQIYPMGAERYISSILCNFDTASYNLRKHVVDKDVLIIPGHGNTAFLFAEAGAKTVTVYDKDPITIAWVKAFKKYYHYREENYPSVGELLTLLTCNYPPLVTLPTQKWISKIFWIIQPNSLRRIYLHYLIQLIQKALEDNHSKIYELDKEIYFHRGTVTDLVKKSEQYHTVFVPYLLGVLNGIEKKEDIVTFLKQLLDFNPQGKILITPSQNTREFYGLGTQYFTTSGYASIQAIEELKPYIIKEEPNWYNKQGLIILGKD